MGSTFCLCVFACLVRVMFSKEIEEESKRKNDFVFDSFYKSLRSNNSNLKGVTKSKHMGELNYNQYFFFFFQKVRGD
jgi:hypothetical protein